MGIAKRKHLFEFEDQGWFSPLLRRLVTDVLHYQITKFQTYKPMMPKIKQVVEKQGYDRIVDLCSGSGGPLPQIQEMLEKQEGLSLSVTLTDKYPNHEAIARIKNGSNGKTDYVEESVDAMTVPKELKGLRTMFTSFHHFRPDDAARILRDAVEKNEGIGVFEFTERSRGMLFKSIFPFIAVLISTPFIRPFTFSRFFFTYVIPVVPIVFFWDALVSNYRTYTPEELQQMVDRIDVDKNYRWEIGKQAAEKPIWNITYLIGYPQTSGV